jgi:hypothetical protein
MTRIKVIGIALAAVSAFATSSLWYSPVLFGRQLVALSGVAASANPDGWKIAAEMLRTCCWPLLSAGSWPTRRQTDSERRSVSPPFSGWDFPLHCFRALCCGKMCHLNWPSSIPETG